RKRERAEGIPSGVIKHIAWLSDDRIAFDLISPTVPGDIWTYGWAGKLAERVTHISHSETIAPTLVEPELRTFQSFD
ncbi:S9 family peptidase, partial [Bacillus amyloliquefaciens]